jgi:hypothetical protein
VDVDHAAAHVADDDDEQDAEQAGDGDDGVGDLTPPAEEADDGEAAVRTNASARWT